MEVTEELQHNAAQDYSPFRDDVLAARKQSRFLSDKLSKSLNAIQMSVVGLATMSQKEEIIGSSDLKMHAVAADGSGNSTAASQFVISCSSSVRALWDLWMLLLCFYVVITIPLLVGFQELQDFRWTVANTFVDFFFVLDIAVHFRTTFIEEETKEEIWDTVAISSNYVYNLRGNGWFPGDVVMSVPHMFATSSMMPYGVKTFLRAAKMCRLLRIFDSHSFADLEFSGAANPSIIRIFKLLVMLGILWHLVACGYWFVSLRTDPYDWDMYLWTPRTDFSASDLWSKYIIAFHWALMATQGELQPAHSSEQAGFSTVVVFIGVLVNASVFGSVTTLLENLDSTANQRIKLMDDVNGYLRFRKVPQDLCARVRAFYEYVWKCGHLMNDEMLDELPEKMKLQLSVCLKKRIIEQVSAPMIVEERFHQVDS